MKAWEISRSISPMRIRNKSGHKTDPCGTPFTDSPWPSVFGL